MWQHPLAGPAVDWEEPFLVLPVLRRRFDQESPDGLIKIWNVETGLEMRTVSDHAGFVRAMSFSPDGKILISADSERIQFWNADNGKGLLVNSQTATDGNQIIVESLISRMYGQ